MHVVYKVEEGFFFFSKNGLVLPLIYKIGLFDNNIIDLG